MWTKLAFAVSLVANVVLLLVLQRPAAKPASAPKSMTLEEFVAEDIVVPADPVKCISLKALKSAAAEVEQQGYARGFAAANAAAMPPAPSRPSLVEQQALRAQRDFYSEAANEIRRQELRRIVAPR